MDYSLGKYINFCLNLDLLAHKVIHHISFTHFNRAFWIQDFRTTALHTERKQKSLQFVEHLSLALLTFYSLQIKENTFDESAFQSVRDTESVLLVGLYSHDPSPVVPRQLFTTAGYMCTVTLGNAFRTDPTFKHVSG